MKRELLLHNKDEDFETIVSIRNDTKEVLFEQLLPKLNIKPDKVVLEFEEFKKVVEAFNALEL